MKTAITTFAIVAFVTVSSASADHKDRDDRHAPPGKLAHALHVQAHNLEEEVEHHYPYAQGMKHQSYIITRLAESTEQDIESGRLYNARRNLNSLENLLDSLDTNVRRSVGMNGRIDGKHVRETIEDMEDIVDSLEHALRHDDHDHFHGGPAGRGGGPFGRPGGPVGGPGGHGGHGDDDHGHAGHGDDHFAGRPGTIQLQRGGVVFQIRLR